jgi:Flp pilus assembly protein TadD
MNKTRFTRLFFFLNMVFLNACGASTSQVKNTTAGPEDTATAPVQDPFEGRTPEEARDYFQSELKTTPNDAILWNALGVACYRLKDYVCTEKALLRGRKLAPRNVGIVSSLGMLRHRQERDEEAKSLLEEALEIDSEYGPAYNNLGLVLLSLKDIKGALKAFEKALQIRPNDLVAMQNLGLLHLYHVRDAKEARVYLEKHLRTLQKYDHNITADDFRHVGVAALFSGDADGAIAFLTEARTMAPDRPDLTFNLGLAYMEVMELGKAVALLKEAFEKAPRYPLHAHFYGRLLTKMKEYTNAIQPLEVAILVAPEDAEAHNALGLCLKNTGKPQASEESYQTACKLGLASACSKR